MPVLQVPQVGALYRQEWIKQQHMSLMLCGVGKIPQLL